MSIIIPPITIPLAPTTINQAPTNDNSITLTGTAQAGSVLTLNQNNIQLEPVPVNDDGIWSFTVILIDGQNVFYAISTDESGNSSTPSDLVLITLDTVPPG